MQNLERTIPERIPLRWKLLVLLLVFGGIGSLLAWSLLLTSFCSHPLTPDPVALHAPTYNCHGRVVAISPLENALRHWLLPSGFLLVFLSILAAARALVVAGAVRISVSANVTGTSDRHDPP